jgi:cytosine/adenosine deaminase-related metal-dependent hydrolase
MELQPLLIHAVHVDADDIQRIKTSGSRVVYCPRSNQRLRLGTMPLADYLAAGVPVYLGTESLASSPSLDVGEEVVAAQAKQDNVDAAAIQDLAEQALS